MLGYIIEPVALRGGRNVSYLYKNSRRINYYTTIYGPKVYKPGEYNCQMNELMFQAGPIGVKGMSERSELTPCIYN